MDAVSLAVVALIGVHDLVNPVVVVASSRAQGIVDELDPPPQGVVGEGRLAGGVGAVLDLFQPVVVVVVVDVAGAPIGRVSQRRTDTINQCLGKRTAERICADSLSHEPIASRCPRG